MVVQMAKASGATVITTVGSDRKAEVAQQLGADKVLNYKAADFGERLKEAAGPGGIRWYETQPPTDLDRPIELSFTGANRRDGRAASSTRVSERPFYVKGLTLLRFAMFNMTADEQRLTLDINRWQAEEEAACVDWQAISARGRHWPTSCRRIIR